MARAADGEQIDDEEMRREIEHFVQEREKIKRVLTEINGRRQDRLNRALDAAFVGALVLLFLLRFVFHRIDNILSLEFGIILLSVKIIWLIRQNNNYNHFTFMIMHSIEYRQNAILERLDELEMELQRQGWERPEAGKPPAPNSGPTVSG